MSSAARPNKRAPPKLDLRAFQSPPAAPARRNYPLHLIDSHIHSWTQEQLDSGDVKWPRESGPVQLSGPHPLEAYGEVVVEGVKLFAGGKSKWGGVVYVQAEAEHDDSDIDGTKGGWKASLNEVETVCAAALAHPEINLLAIVPWAPIHHGAVSLTSYLDQVASLPSLSALTSKLGKSPITSVRYLLQDSPRGLFLTADFIDGLKELGKRGVAFDLTLDVRSEKTGGIAILDDAQEMITKVHEGVKEGEQTVFILDHFAKPSLSDEIFSTSSRLSTFQQSYISALHSLSLLPHTYLKLSGFLDFAPAELLTGAFEEFKEKRAKSKDGDYATLKERVLAYLEPAIEAWGIDRILVGSDWPMFRPHLLPSTSTSPTSPSATIAAEAAAWAFEMQLYLDCLVQLGLEGEDLDKIFAGNARRVYKA